MSNSPLLAAHDGFVSVHGHGRQHYLDAGSGEPLVLIHGNGASAWQYVDVIPLLLPRMRVIAWDMPGHGDSDPLGRHYSVEDYADALSGFLQALGLASAHVCGCSSGGSICAAFASRYPAAVRSALIVEPAFRSETEWAASWAQVEADFGLPTQTAQQMGERVAKVDEPRLARWNIDRNKAGARTMVDVMWALRAFDLGQAAKSIRCPAMLLYGRRSPTIHGQERFQAAAHIPLQVMEGSAHFPMLDEPAAFAEVIASFCAKHAAA
ncbi:MAG: alpha/beta hydrolase [Burkholderiales bacterium]|nr:alpha/beta hydrolase [Burkholderiales bacterium]